MRCVELGKMHAVYGCRLLDPTYHWGTYMYVYVYYWNYQPAARGTCRFRAPSSLAASLDLCIRACVLGSGAHSQYAVQRAFMMQWWSYTVIVKNRCIILGTRLRSTSLRRVVPHKLNFCYFVDVRILCTPLRRACTYELLI